MEYDRADNFRLIRNRTEVFFSFLRLTERHNQRSKFSWNFNLMEYNQGDNFAYVLVPNGIQFSSKTEEKDGPCKPPLPPQQK